MYPKRERRNHLQPKILQNENCQNDFLEEGGLSPLLKLLLTQNPGLQIRTLAALGNLINNGKLV